MVGVWRAGAETGLAGVALGGASGAGVLVRKTGAPGAPLVAGYICPWGGVGDITVAVETDGTAVGNRGAADDTVRVVAIKRRSTLFTTCGGSGGVPRG